MAVVSRRARGLTTPLLRRRLPARPAEGPGFGLRGDFHERFRLRGKIGQGAYGAVHAAERRGPGPPSPGRGIRSAVAVKVLAKAALAAPAAARALGRELDVWAAVHHSLAVAHLEDAYEDEKHVYVVMELCRGGGLGERGPVPESEARGLLADVLAAVAHCHAAGIVHRDVKPANFLLAEEAGGGVKMVDFGFGKFLAAPGSGGWGSGLRRSLSSRRVGSPLYLSPEMLEGSYGPPVDLWGAGCVLYKLLTGRTPFERDVRARGGNGEPEGPLTQPVLFGRIKSKEFAVDTEVDAVWRGVSAECKDLLRRLLARDPAERITAEAALRHPFVAPERAGGARRLVQSMQLFASLPAAQRALLVELYKHLPIDLQGAYGESFARLAEQEGALAPAVREAMPQELSLWLAERGYRVSEAECFYLAQAISLRGSSSLTRDEFCASCINWHAFQGQGKWADACRSVFDDLDREGRGAVPRGQLLDLLRPYGVAAAGLDALLAEVGERRPPAAQRWTRRTFEPLFRTTARARPEFFPSRWSGAERAASGGGRAGLDSAEFESIRL